ncbi:MAG: ATP-binding protein [Culturomica sp.]|nr:ATP-binding protein [Culturomica sp.]
MKANIIKSIQIYGLWRKYDFIWEHLNEDVNVLIGINGSGKTTLFNIIDALLTADLKQIKTYNVKVEMQIGERLLSYDSKTTSQQMKAQLADVNYVKISTFDIPLKDKPKAGKEFSQLYNELYDIVYRIGGEEPSFSDYRLKATNFPEQAKRVNTRIQTFYKTVDALFSKTGKIIGIDPYTNHLIFRNGDETIPLHKLSSGEKQLLIILLKAFLMEEKPYILLMDEPEISLHIEWQYRLLEEIRKLNPNCQIITSTHSPSIFGDGWSDKLFFVDELIYAQPSSR